MVSLLDDSAVDIPVGYDPSPAEIREGRALFYDAAFSSAHGEATCASCHVFAGMDNISWDLGDPTGELSMRGAFTFHPMKGPMATQSLKGLPATSPFHWRGDRETLADFNEAFVALLGRSSELTAGEFASFEAFIELVIYPPNPNQHLDGSLPDPLTGPNPSVGRDLYETGGLVASGSLDCVDCHLFPTGETDLIIPASLLQDTQDLVVPHLRNMYEKTRFDRDSPTNVRGFGFTKDGAVDGMMRFLEFPGFSFNNDGEREDVAAFMMAFNFETAAAVGAQWTLDATNGAIGIPQISTLMSVADQGQVGLIAKGPDGAGVVRGWTYLGADSWMPDRDSDPTADLDDLVLLAAVEPITFTAVLLGSEDRLGTDRDRDGFLDQDERDAGSDPANPASTPDATTVPDVAGVIGADIRVTPSPARGSLVTVTGGFDYRALHDHRARRTGAPRSNPRPQPHRGRIDVRDRVGRPKRSRASHRAGHLLRARPGGWFQRIAAPRRDALTSRGKIDAPNPISASCQEPRRVPSSFTRVPVFGRSRRGPRPSRGDVAGGEPPDPDRWRLF